MNEQLKGTVGVIIGRFQTHQLHGGHLDVRIRARTQWG